MFQEVIETKNNVNKQLANMATTYVTIQNKKL